MEHYSSSFSPGMKVEIRIPVPHAHVFCDWVVINDVDEDMVTLQLSRDILPEGINLRIRTKIATLLRTLLTTADTSGSVKAQVLALSGTYGELDGENNYNYATVMANVYKSLSDAQKTKLMALRASIMKGTYADSTSFNFTYTATPYLYSAVISDATAAGYIGNTDSLFK